MNSLNFIFLMKYNKSYVYTITYIYSFGKMVVLLSHDFDRVISISQEENMCGSRTK